ncbi:20430_t:CDS:2, partial [Racocetra persica]
MEAQDQQEFCKGYTQAPSDYGVINNFLNALKTIKSQNIENFRQIININEYMTPIDPKEVATYISNNIL